MSSLVSQQLSSERYVRSLDHLHDELARIELLIRAQVIRWQLSGACAGPECDWGMVLVSRAEVERYLQSTFTPPGTLPENIQEQLKPWWDKAAALRNAIDTRCNGSDLRLLRLANLFNLGTAETDILLLCLISEIDERYRRLFGYLQNDASKQLPSVELVTQILCPVSLEIGDCRDLFSPTGNLLSNRLVVTTGGAASDESFSQRSLRIEDRIAGFLLSSDDPDPRLAGVLRCANGSLPVRALARVEIARLLNSLRQLLHSRLGANESVRVLIAGPDPKLNSSIACETTRSLGIPLLEFDVGAALRRGVTWDVLIDVAYREARICDGAILFRDCDRLLNSNQESDNWEYLESSAAGFNGLTFAVADALNFPSGAVSDAAFVQLDVPFPDFDARRSAWLTCLASSPDPALPEAQRISVATELAGAFQTTDTQIEDAIAGARNLTQRENPMAGKLDGADLFAACRRQGSRRLVSFAQRIEPRRNLSLVELILPESNKRQLIELHNRIRFRRELFQRTGFAQTMRLGKGLLALFTGASGTGKTMAAEALASGQGVDLYKVDLSAIVSKWIGETEKNLSRIFSEAESSNGWLFFDEGESLFGSRGDIKQAQDRVLNLEVNYLLQRIEEFSGVVILATNLRQNIDDAFLRRISAFVEFPNPSSESRAQIWQSLLPAIEQRDFDDQQLARVAERFELSGGNIRNVVLDAMFRACSSADETLTLRHLAAGIAREYQKLNRPVTRTEFGETFYEWVVEDLLNPAPASPGLSI